MTIYSLAATAKLLQSCLTLSDPMDCSLSGSSVHGIFQARVLEWVAIAFSDTAWMYSFSYLEPVCCSMSSSNCCFLTCIQVSQEVGQVFWYPHLFLEEISSLPHSVVFFYFFALITEGLLISSCYSLELCIQMLISFLFSFAFCFSSFQSYL